MTHIISGIAGNMENGIYFKELQFFVPDKFDLPFYPDTSRPFKGISTRIPNSFYSFTAGFLYFR